MKVFKAIGAVVINISLTVLLLFSLIPESSSAQSTEKPFSNSSFFNLSGTEIHYREWKAQGVCNGNILLIHGFCGSTFSWRKTADSLWDKGYHVIAVDLPPYGFSDKDPSVNQSSTFRAKLLYDFINSLYPGEKWCVAGHSMGGSVAEAFAIMYPQITDKLILVDGVLFTELKISERSYTIFSFHPLQKFLASIGEEYFIKPDKLKSFLASAYGRQPEGNEVAGYLTPLQVEGTARAIIASAESCEITNVVLNGNGISTLAVWGENDNWVPVASFEGVLIKFGNIKTEIIKNCGHCPMETHHNEFMKILLEFLKN